MIKPKYEIGQIVYLTTDKDQYERIVTGILIEQHGVSYKIANGTDVYWASEIEVSFSKDILKQITN